jgi:hypothetical protein
MRLLKVNCEREARERTGCVKQAPIDIEHQCVSPTIKLTRCRDLEMLTVVHWRLMSELIPETHNVSTLKRQNPPTQRHQS